MTFPQSSSERAVTSSQEYWRLTTLVATAGDLYESAVGAKAFAIGPDSDFGAYRISYYDELVGTPALGVADVNVFRLSPDRSFIGRVNASNVNSYLGSGQRKQRILIGLDDIYDFTWRPDPFTPAADVIAFETPQIDILQYFEEAPSLIPQRSDRIFRYQYLANPPTPGQSSFIVIPAYGRKSGYFTFVNLDGIATVTARVYGVKLSISALPGPVGSFQQQLHSQAILSQGVDKYVFKSSVDGIWDLLVVELSGYIGAAMPTTVTLSDDVL